MNHLITLRELQLSLQISEATLRRYLAEARRGVGDFPLPVSKPKRKLLWNPADIERWIGCHSQPTLPDIETASQRLKRHAAAMEALGRKGVILPSKQQSK